MLFDHVGHDLHFVERCHIGHGVALLDPLANFRVLGRHVAVEAGDDRVLGELILEPFDGGRLHGNLRAGLSDLLDARAGDRHFIGGFRF